MQMTDTIYITPMREKDWKLNCKYFVNICVRSDLCDLLVLCHDFFGTHTVKGDLHEGIAADEFDGQHGAVTKEAAVDAFADLEIQLGGRGGRGDCCCLAASCFRI